MHHFILKAIKEIIILVRLIYINIIGPIIFALWLLDILNFLIIVFKAAN